jgi:hypothetical protein
MYALTGVSENDVEAFFHLVLLDFMNSPTQWDALLSIRKEYVALNEPPKPLTTYFVFAIKPFDAHEPHRKKRARRYLAPGDYGKRGAAHAVIGRYTDATVSIPVTAGAAGIDLPSGRAGYVSISGKARMQANAVLRFSNETAPSGPGSGKLVGKDAGPP